MQIGTKQTNGIGEQEIRNKGFIDRSYVNNFMENIIGESNVKISDILLSWQKSKLSIPAVYILYDFLSDWAH